MPPATRRLLEGTHAISYGVQLARAGVIAAHPTPPASSIIELLSDMCGDGRLQARFVAVESEHSAMATCAGASQAGVRAFTATSSHGLACMHEMLHWCAGARLPVVLANVNGAVGSPRNIFVDQNDSLSQRDTGWIQYYCETNQEVLDSLLQAFFVAERVLLPAMVCLDAVFLSQASEPVLVPAHDAVDAWLPPFAPEYSRSTDALRAFGGLTAGDSYMELRARMQHAMEDAIDVAEQAARSYGEALGTYQPLVERLGAEHADVLLVTSGTVTSTARVVLAARQAAGEAVGLVRLRLFRPFPFAAVRNAVRGAKKVAVIDRNVSFGHGGIMASELRAALCNVPEAPIVFSFVAGLGGRDITTDVIGDIVRYVMERDRPDADTLWVGLKG